MTMWKPRNGVKATHTPIADAERDGVRRAGEAEHALLDSTGPNATS